MNIADLDKADVLMELFKAARPSKFMSLFVVYPSTLSREQAIQALKPTGHIGKLHGRVLNINLDWGQFDESAYDAANGFGCAKTAIDALRARIDRTRTESQTIASYAREPERSRSVVHEELVFAPFAVSFYEPPLENKRVANEDATIVSGGDGNFGGGGASGHWPEPASPVVTASVLAAVTTSLEAATCSREDEAKTSQRYEVERPACVRENPVTPTRYEPPTPEQYEPPTPTRYEAPTPERYEPPTPARYEAPTPERYEAPAPERYEPAASSWGSSGSESNAYSSDSSPAESSSSTSTD